MLAGQQRPRVGMGARSGHFVQIKRTLPLEPALEFLRKPFSDALASLMTTQADLTDMPSEFAAALSEWCCAIASCAAILPGPMATAPATETRTRKRARTEGPGCGRPATDAMKVFHWRTTWPFLVLARNLYSESEQPNTTDPVQARAGPFAGDPT